MTHDDKDKEIEQLHEALRLIDLHAQQGLLTPEYTKSYLLEICDLTKQQRGKE